MSDLKRSIKQDYLTGEASLRPFYQSPLDNLDFETAIARKQLSQEVRNTLADDLLAQYEGIDLDQAPQVRQNIEALRSPDCYTATTGHQLVLMGGPMFTQYKIATAIRMAEQLRKQFPDKQFVPVFWMATEDHDWEEVNHFFLNYCDKVTYNAEFGGAVGRHILQGNLQEIWPEGQPYTEFFPAGKNYAQAYRAFMHHFFKDKGLVILDADRPALKSVFKEVMREELTSHSAETAINTTNAQLEKLGYNLQVHPREINLFYLADGVRERIIKHGAGFALADGSQEWPAEALFSELEAHPERFSPNVTLRPLYQEMILPNLAYTGGWGELSYWMQLKGVFDHFDVPFPALIPRFTATLLTQEQADRATKLGFAPSDLGMHLHRLQDAYIPKLWDDAPFQVLREQVMASYSDMEAYLEGLDPTLARSLAADQARAQKRMDRMYKKVKKSFRNKHSGIFEEMQALKSEVEPSNQVQERVMNFTTLPLSAESLLSIIYQHSSPFTVFDKQWIVLP